MTTALIWWFFIVPDVTTLQTVPRSWALWLCAVNAAVACCRFRGHEDKIVTKELKSRNDETEVQP